MSSLWFLESKQTEVQQIIEALKTELGYFQSQCHKPRAAELLLRDNLLLIFSQKDFKPLCKLLRFLILSRDAQAQAPISDEAGAPPDGVSRRHSMPAQSAIRIQQPQIIAESEQETVQQLTQLPVAQLRRKQTQAHRRTNSADFQQIQARLSPTVPQDQSSYMQNNNANGLGAGLSRSSRSIDGIAQLLQNQQEQAGSPLAATGYYDIGGNNLSRKFKRIRSASETPQTPQQIMPQASPGSSPRMTPRGEPSRTPQPPSYPHMESVPRTPRNRSNSGNTQQQQQQSPLISPKGSPGSQLPVRPPPPAARIPQMQPVPALPIEEISQQVNENDGQHHWHHHHHHQDSEHHHLHHHHHHLPSVPLAQEQQPFPSQLSPRQLQSPRQQQQQPHEVQSTPRQYRENVIYQRRQQSIG